MRKSNRSERKNLRTYRTAMMLEEKRNKIEWLIELKQKSNPELNIYLPPSEVKFLCTLCAVLHVLVISPLCFDESLGSFAEVLHLQRRL